MPPLAGLKVLDFSLNLPGPYATALLAAQGATVVKVEPPRGDPARHMQTFFARVNGGKHSVVLDLRTDEGRAALPALFAWADVVVEGFRPGVMERLGAGPAEAHAVDPRIVYARISGFGQQGPRRDEPAHDLNLQALTGLCELERDDAPRALRLPVADLSSSLTAVAAIGVALAGPRDHVVLDLSMAHTLLQWTWLWDAVDPAVQLDAATRGQPGIVRSLLAPLRRRLSRERLYAMPQYGLYRAADGWLALGIVDERHFWKQLAEKVGLQRWSGLAMPQLTVLAPFLRRRIASRLRKQPVAHWLQVLDGLPVTAVPSPQQALHERQFAAWTAREQVLAPLPDSVPLGPPPALGSTRWDQLPVEPNPP